MLASAVGASATSHVVASAVVSVFSAVVSLDSWVAGVSATSPVVASVFVASSAFSSSFASDLVSSLGVVVSSLAFLSSLASVVFATFSIDSAFHLIHLNLF